MKISTKGRYSVTALYELALRYGEGAVSLKSIATSQGLSENYLEQLMAPLRRAGIVKSVRGAQGGDVAERAAITGALSLYLNFINLFTLLLQLLGQRD